MKLRSVRPIYHEGTVRTEGTVFETLEQHGRVLIKKGYAEEVVGKNPADPEQPEQQPEDDKPKSKAKSK